MNRSIWLSAGLGAMLVSMAATATPLRADEWSKSYKVSGKANLHVETDDGDVTVTSGADDQVDARVVTDGYKIGPSDVRIEERQDGDNVTVSVKMPHMNFSFFGGHKSVHVELR